MDCKCTGWRKVPGMVAQRQCGPMTRMGLRRIVAGIHRGEKGFHVGLTFLNPIGLYSGSTYGHHPFTYLRTAKRFADEELRDELRSRFIGC